MAVDWSGAKQGAGRRIWLAEAGQDGLVRLECGRSREALIEHLVVEAARDPEMAVGLDFAFSTPAWFLDHLGAPGGPELWVIAAKHGEGWLRTCPWPWWGRPRVSRPAVPAHFRREEVGIGAKSIFQVGGAGAVGTGSLRGMPGLLRLAEAGFSIWPFHDPRLPVVVEIYPRLLTGPVVKSRREGRSDYLSRRCPELDPELRARAVESEDAFDAAVSAVVMWAHSQELAALPRRGDRREGAIWRPRGQPSVPAQARQRPKTAK